MQCFCRTASAQPVSTLPLARRAARRVRPATTRRRRSRRAARFAPPGNSRTLARPRAPCALRAPSRRRARARARTARPESTALVAQALCRAAPTARPASTRPSRAFPFAFRVRRATTARSAPRTTRRTRVPPASTQQRARAHALRAQAATTVPLLVQTFVRRASRARAPRWPRAAPVACRVRLGLTSMPGGRPCA